MKLRKGKINNYFLIWFLRSDTIGNYNHLYCQVIETYITRTYSAISRAIFTQILTKSGRI